MSADLGRGPAMIVGGRPPLVEALNRSLVRDGWTVLRPPPASPPTGDGALLEALQAASSPPAGLVMTIDAQRNVLEATSQLSHGLSQLGPQAAIVLVRDFGPRADYLERLAEGALRTMAQELARQAAPARRVNAVYAAPPASDTGTVPRRRAGTVDDLAAAATFLLGRSSAFMTGVTLRLDGGADLGWSLAGL